MRGELSCLFADSNVGKSILAVQIADRIARTDIVLYLDFELSKNSSSFAIPTDMAGCIPFPTNCTGYQWTATPCWMSTLREAIIGSIEQMALQTECRIFIVDNLTYLCCAIEKGDAAGRLMIHLNNLKRGTGCQSLYWHTLPKRSMGAPSHPTTLQGSKRLYNFFDSVFAIGKSALDGGLRYVKQLKGALWHLLP